MNKKSNKFRQRSSKNERKESGIKKKFRENMKARGDHAKVFFFGNNGVCKICSVF